MSMASDLQLTSHGFDYHSRTTAQQLEVCTRPFLGLPWSGRLKSNPARCHFGKASPTGSGLLKTLSQQRTNIRRRYNARTRTTNY